MQELIGKLNAASRAYYDGNDAIMSDDEWDAMYAELRKLEAQTGERLADSPTRRVGGANVSGVQRGMTQQEQKIVRSGAHEAAPSIFAAGDRVLHRKFGKGAVIRVTGSGSDARIMIRFDDTRVGVKEFALSIAPIIKTEG